MKDSILGCFLGYAIGDALGLATEFMTKPQAAMRYPAGARRYEDIYRDAHRSQWERGDFTLDTEIVLRLAEVLNDNGHVSPVEFSRMLKEWYTQFPYDFDSHFRRNFKEASYAEDPIGTCRRVWEATPRPEAWNEALGRAMLMGLCRDDVERKVTENCQCTHYDPRCVSSAVVIGKMANSLLWKGEMADYDDLVALCEEIDERTIPYLRLAHEADISRLRLDDSETYWYTRKTMAAALWALWHDDGDPMQAAYAVIDEAGDGDTNAALALGLLGLKHGPSILPQHLLDGLLQRERVVTVARRFAEGLFAFNKVES